MAGSCQRIDAFYPNYVLSVIKQPYIKVLRKGLFSIQSFIYGNNNMVWMQQKIKREFLKVSIKKYF